MPLQRLLQHMSRLQIGAVSASGRSARIHTAPVLCKSEDRRQMKASLPAKDEGTLGERTANIDSILFKLVCVQNAFDALYLMFFFLLLYLRVKGR